MIRLHFMTVLGITTAFSGSWARGSIIVDHPPHPYGGPGSDTAFLSPFGQPLWQRVADDFVLSTASEAVRIVYHGFYNEDNPPLNETMRIRFYLAREGDGLPDDNEIISETTVQNPSRTATGVIIQTGHGPHEYRFEADLAAPVPLNAQTKYWLEVAQLGDLNTHFRWETSVAGNNNFSFINNGVADWQTVTNQGDLSFQLLSPEPASIVMFGLGLVILFRRRKY